jgi:hypothetical protein
MVDCNKCGLPISFKKSSNGKWIPTNPDSSEHWDLCKATRRKLEGPVIKFHAETKATELSLSAWDGVGVPW